MAHYFGRNALKAPTSSDSPQSRITSMKKHIVYPVLLMGLWLGAGCESEPERTAALRQSLDPKAEAFLQDADRARQTGDFEAAFAALDSAAAYTPALADIPFRRGRAYLTLNRLADARSAFEEALELDSYYPGAWYELGNIEFRERQYQSALEGYQREEAVLVHLLDEGAPLSVAGPQALAATRLQLGRVRNKLGDVDGAYEAFRSALAADSTFAEADYELSRLYETDGEFAQALEHARRAYASDSSSVDNQYILGALLLRNSRPEEALPYLEAAVAGRPWYHPSLNNLGRALVELGRRNEAEEYLARAENMRALEIQTAQARLDVQASPKNPQRWIALARSLVQAGRYDEADEAFNNAIYLDPMNLAFHNDAANLTLLRGDEGGAIRRFQTIVEFDSTFAPGWMNLGVAYAVAERYEEAQQAWERVLRYEPDHVEAKANLALLADMR